MLRELLVVLLHVLMHVTINLCALQPIDFHGFVGFVSDDDGLGELVDVNVRELVGPCGSVVRDRALVRPRICSAALHAAREYRDAVLELTNRTFSHFSYPGRLLARKRSDACKARVPMKMVFALDESLLRFHGEPVNVVLVNRLSRRPRRRTHARSFWKWRRRQP